MSPGETGPIGGQSSYDQIGNQFDQILVLHNPNSSQANLADSYIDELRRSKFGGIMLEPIKTSIDRETEEQKLIELLSEYEDSSTLLVTIGGDGTSTRILRPLLSDKLNHLEIVALAVACGDANDFAIMANGDPEEISLVDLIDHGKVVEMNPIDATFLAPDGDEFSIPAFSYVGFGNTAMLSHRFNAKEYREKTNGANRVKRRFEQGKIILSQMPKARLGEFAIKDQLGERMVHEITVVSGHRMAELGKPDPGLKLTDPTLLKLTYEKGNFLKSASWMGRLALGRLPGEYLYEGDVYDFLLESEVLMHADAEVRNIDRNTFVQIQQHKRTISFISSLL